LKEIKAFAIKQRLDWKTLSKEHSMKRHFAWFALSILAISSALLAQQAAFTAIPKKYQLYPRDANDSAAVTISGSVTTAGFDSVLVTVFKNGAQYKRAMQTLTYSNGSAAFSLSPKIHAELANYKFEIRVNTALLISIDSVVCGDAYFIEGQSNAVCYSNWTYKNSWVRSFGNSGVATEGSNSAVITADTAWGIGQCEYYNDSKNFPSSTMWHCAIGVWGMQTGRHIVENHSIPVCIINGAVGGSDISVHQRNLNINSAYGAVYYRVTKAGLKNSLKAIFWCQGETDCIDAYHAGLYKAGFNSLYSSWKSDFAGVQHIYVFQVRPGSGAAEIVCETQRTTPQGRTDVSVMSTTGITDYGGLHYGYTGYQQFGDRLYRLLARDFYRSADTINVGPPDILSASFSDGTRTRLVLQFNQPVLLPASVNMQRYFALDTAHGPIDSATSNTVKHTVTVFLHSSSNAATVSCLPGGNYPVGGVTNEGPWITNPRNIGVLSFRGITISNGTNALNHLGNSFARGAAANKGCFTIIPGDRLISANASRVIGVYDIRGIQISNLPAGAEIIKNKTCWQVLVVRTR
jgi:hypothetical protein